MAFDISWDQYFFFIFTCPLLMYINYILLKAHIVAFNRHQQDIYEFVVDTANSVYINNAK